MLLKYNSKVLFIGDSITDCGATTGNDPEKLGNGYPRYIRDYIYSQYPELNINIINKGISGNRTSNLLDRWQSDVIEHNPDILSICIGTNDIWRQFDNPTMDIIDADKYEANLRTMLQLTKKSINPVIVMFEVPPIEKGHNNYECSEALSTTGNELICQYNKRVHKIASEFDTYLCPINKILSNNMRQTSNIKYTNDGVHPCSTGIMTFAMSWLKTINL